jgi:hypothetical protein
MVYAWIPAIGGHLGKSLTSMSRIHAILAKIVDEHRGKIAVESEHGALPTRRMKKHVP